MRTIQPTDVPDARSVCFRITAAEKHIGVMHLLKNIPCELVGKVFRDWLDLKLLVRLDSAVCNYDTRPLLLRILASNHCIRGKHELHIFSHIATRAEWFTKRKIQLSRLQIDEPSNSLSQYLRLFSKSLRHVCCKHSGAIDMVALHCRDLESLTCIDLETNPNLNAAFGYNANLQELRLEGVEELHASDFEHVCFSKLSLLSLCNTACSDAVLSAIIRTTKVLQQVNVGYYSNITDEGVIALAQHCPLLRSLGLSELPISDGALEQLVELCPNIESLDLEDNAVLTDSGVLSVVSQLKQLRRLNLCDCKRLTDISLEHVAHACANTLQTLNVAGIEKVRVDALVHLLQQCQQLRELYLDWGINTYCAEIVPYMRHLHSLTVHSVVFDDCLCTIARHCQQLQNLAIPCMYKVNKHLPAIAHPPAAKKADAVNVHVLHCANYDAFDDDPKYTEKGLIALMQGLPLLRLLEGSALTCDSTDSCAPACRLAQVLWQRVRPAIEFKEYDESLDFDVFEI